MSDREPPDDALRAAILDLLSRRAGSICPSEAARAVGGAGWRDLMEPARQAARALARAGVVEITQGTTALDPDGTWRGPVRIRPRRA
ncbi:MAG: DUF3253 domain-containing protein [Mycobacterium sp.]